MAMVYIKCSAESDIFPVSLGIQKMRNHGGTEAASQRNHQGGLQSTEGADVQEMNPTNAKMTVMKEGQVRALDISNKQCTLLFHLIAHRTYFSWGKRHFICVYKGFYSPVTLRRWLKQKPALASWSKRGFAIRNHICFVEQKGRRQSSWGTTTRNLSALPCPPHICSYLSSHGLVFWRLSLHLFIVWGIVGREVVFPTLYHFPVQVLSRIQYLLPSHNSKSLKHLIYYEKTCLAN